jgi:hypothetical protein
MPRWPGHCKYTTMAPRYAFINNQGYESRHMCIKTSSELRKDHDCGQVVYASSGTANSSESKRIVNYNLHKHALATSTVQSCTESRTIVWDERCPFSCAVAQRGCCRCLNLGVEDQLCEIISYIRSAWNEQGQNSVRHSTHDIHPYYPWPPTLVVCSA